MLGKEKRGRERMGILVSPSKIYSQYIVLSRPHVLKSLSPPKTITGCGPNLEHMGLSKNITESN
jgi:hypothetical protein